MIKIKDLYVIKYYVKTKDTDDFEELVYRSSIIYDEKPDNVQKTFQTFDSLLEFLEHNNFPYRSYKGLFSNKRYIKFDIIDIYSECIVKENKFNPVTLKKEYQKISLNNYSLDYLSKKLSVYQYFELVEDIKNALKKGNTRNENENF